MVVAASGNTYGLGVDYPAKYENIISISSVNKEFKRASSSAKGKIDFAAPHIVEHLLQLVLYLYY
ncbi:S8 family serine peptidase [Bacillus cereus group sp. BfR-BA-01400]|uniref:S8 family serine peptidase n=1 Tax=Bacillus cereus group sp. BfR-BA-01400 TaxID=2920334 RepID=UPI001F56D4A3